MRAAVVSIVCLVLPGCIATVFDSRWIQQKQVQKHNAEAMAPEKLAPSPTAAAGNAKAYKVRVHATSAYVAQTVDWKHDTRELFAEANVILEPTLGVRLEVAGMETWSANADDLASAMTTLRAEDAGTDVEWVVGFIGGLPKYESSFDQIGLGHVLGKHLLLRSSIDLGEHAAIENLDGVSAADKAKLVHDRRHHRATATLLHELGHTLGALHEDDKFAVMNPYYSPKMRGYGKVAPVLLRIGLAHHGESDKRPLYREALDYYKSNTESWVEKERVGFVADLEKALGPAPATSASVAKPKVDVSMLSDADRAVYDKAAKLFDDGKVLEAREAAKPLFAAYPKTLAVQELRCQLAMKLTTDVDSIRAECRLYMDISTGK